MVNVNDCLVFFEPVYRAIIASTSCDCGIFD